MTPHREIALKYGQQNAAKALCDPLLMLTHTPVENAEAQSAGQPRP